MAKYFKVESWRSVSERIFELSSLRVKILNVFASHVYMQVHVQLVMTTSVAYQLPVVPANFRCHSLFAPIQVVCALQVSEHLQLVTDVAHQLPVVPTDFRYNSFLCVCKLRMCVHVLAFVQCNL